MSPQQALQPTPTPTEQAHRRSHRCYTVAQVCEALEIPRRSFFHLRQTGQLPFVEELLPRIGRVLRFRADLIDRYLSGELGQPRAFRSHGRDRRAVSASTVSPIFRQSGS